MFALSRAQSDPTVPGIAFLGDDNKRRAWLVGTSLDVWRVIEAYKDFGESFARVTAETDLSGELHPSALDT